MLKYKRRSINQKPELHDKEFVTVDDAEDLVKKVAEHAVKSGADEDKMMGFFNDE